MSKKNYSRLILLALIVAGLFSAWSYTFSYQKVQILIDDGLQASVYQSTPGNNTYNGKGDLSVDRSDSYRLKKGGYVLVFHGSQDFASSSQHFNLGDKKVDLTVHPDYSDQKIAKLLKTVQPAIDSVLINTYPSQMQSYTIQKATLLDRGEWYGANLAYHGNDPYDADTLKVVLHKTGDSWAVATKPPDISLSTKFYPTVPKYILSKVNRL